MHAMAKVLKRLAMKKMVDDGLPFTAERDFWIDLIVLAEELEEATMSHLLTPNHRQLYIFRAGALPQTT